MCAMLLPRLSARPPVARESSQHPAPAFVPPQGLYNQADAGGFIKLQALRLRTLGVARKR